MKLILKLHSNDLVRLLLLMIIHGLIWTVFFGWDGNRLLLSEDGAAHHFPTISQIFAHDPLLPFHFGVGGGIALFPVTGILHPEYLLHRLGLDLFTAINWTMILIQSLATWHLIGFISLWRRIRTMDWIFAILMMGFAPVVIMRFRAGHVNFILSSLIIPLGLYLGSIARKRIKPGFSSLLITTYSISLLFGFLAHQGIYYSLLCITPMLLFLIFSRRSLKVSLSSLVPVVAMSGIALVFSFMELRSQISFYASNEISRSIQDQLALFSYLAPSLDRWKASLFYGLNTISTDHPAWQHHELSYPFATLLIGFVVTLFRSVLGRKVLALTLIPAITLFAVSMNTSGITEWMITLLPGFGSFRVIQRFMIPVVLMMTCLLLLFNRPQPRFRKQAHWLALLILITIGATTHHYWNQHTILIEMLAVIGLMMSIKIPALRILSLAFLAGISFSASLERKPEFATPILPTHPYFKIEGLSQNPLERTEFQKQVRTPTNAGLIFNIQTVSFYSNPSRTFTSLVGDFTHRDETYGMYFNFQSEHTPPLLKSLYNISTRIEQADSRLISIPDQSSHSIRFPTRIHQSTPLEIRWISENPKRTEDYLLNTLDADVSDESIPKSCAGINAKPLRTSLDEITYTLEGPTKDCYAVLPLNHSGLYEVTGIHGFSTSEQKLETLATHRTLLGVRLPEGLRQLSIRPVNLLNSTSIAIEKTLGIILVFLLYLAFRMGNPEIRKPNAKKTSPS
jgi:hypothetical protein